MAFSIDVNPMSTNLGFEPVDLTANDLISVFAANVRKFSEQHNNSQKPPTEKDANSLCLVSRDAELALTEAYKRFGGYDRTEMKAFIDALGQALKLMPSEYEASQSMSLRSERIAKLCQE